MRRIALLLSVTVGCAGTFQAHIPKGWTIDQDLDCSESPGFWLLDSVLAVASAGLALASFDKASAGDPSASDSGSEVYTLLGLAGIAVALGFTVSGVVGEGWADQCGRAREQQQWHPAYPSGPSAVDSPEAVELRRQRTEALKRQHVAVPADAGADAADDAAGGE